MAAIVVGLALSTYGLVPSLAVLRGTSRPGSVRYYARAMDDGPLTGTHWWLLFVLGVALVIDVMKPATLGFILPGLRAEYGISTREAAMLPFVALTGTTIGSLVWGVLADRLGAAREAASRLQVVVAMKGGATFVVTPQGQAWSYGSGNVGLATSGSGDTLAGIVAGLLARGAAPVAATLWGVFLHGEAGAKLARSRGPIGFLARELLAEIPFIMAGHQPPGSRRE